MCALKRYMRTLPLKALAVCHSLLLEGMRLKTGGGEQKALVST